MSEHPHVHAPQQGIHSWRDFSVHIAVVTIGLLLAIGLQQVVEFVHHRNERAHLEEQMRETFVTNLDLIADDLTKIAVFRSYLMDVRLAIDARIGGSSASQPSESDQRNFYFFPPPDIGAFEAAKASGTVALLSLDNIRLYDRVLASHDTMQTEFQRYLTAVSAVRAFRLRFETAPGTRYRLAYLDLAKLSTAELVEYRALIGDMLGTGDGYALRLRNLDVQARAILDGARTEGELRAAMAKPLGAGARVP